eukprot:15365614-Alexandrium_andersonii.AAC.1
MPGTPNRRGPHHPAAVASGCCFAVIRARRRVELDCGGEWRWGGAVLCLQEEPQQLYRVPGGVTPW